MPKLLSKPDDFAMVYSLRDTEILANGWIDRNNGSFVIQGSGVFKVVSNPMISCLIPVTDDNLRGELLNFTYDPTNAYIVEQRFLEYSNLENCMAFALAYFQAIFAKYRAESNVILLANEEQKTWRVFIPVQINGQFAGVDYIPPTAESLETHKGKPHHPKVVEAYNEYSELYAAGWRSFGTIHSHCSFTAFHSSTDDKDDKDNDGLHITIGKVNTEPDFAARLMIRGRHWDYTLKELSVRESSVVRKANATRIVDLSRFFEDQRRFVFGGKIGGSVSIRPNNYALRTQSAGFFDPDIHDIQMRMLAEDAPFPVGGPEDGLLPMEDAVFCVDRITDDVFILLDDPDDLESFDREYEIILGDDIKDVINATR